MNIFVRKKERFLLKLWIFTLLAFAFYNEYLVYLLQSFKWPQTMECRNNYNCTKILFVSDPQILGETFDTNFYAPLAIFDSDRNLRTTFNRAYNYAQPDVVCFLGDLMDEGSVANQEQYNKYFHRFKSIFEKGISAYTIYIPGDNDIGGEGMEPVKQRSVHHFRLFTDRDNWNYKNIIFHHLNRITNQLPAITYQQQSENTKKFIIFLSHYSILHRPGTFSYRALETYKPHVIFSGHRHESLKIKSNEQSLHASSALPVNYDGNKLQFKWNDFDLASLRSANDYLEILVPTCSYRMGVRKIGYGMAVLDNNSLYYTVLWSPNRFIQLISYVVVLLLPFLYLFFKVVINLIIYLNSIRRIVFNCKRPKYLPII